MVPDAIIIKKTKAKSEKIRVGMITPLTKPAVLNSKPMIATETIRTATMYDKEGKEVSTWII